MIVWPAYKSADLYAQYKKLQQENPDGFSMNLQGDKVHAKSGYVVALRTFDDAWDAIHNAIEGSDLKGIVLGYWKDEEGKEYFEVSLWTHILTFALDLGAKKEQQAIWSFKDGEEIWLGAGETRKEPPTIVPPSSEPFSKYQSQE